MFNLQNQPIWHIFFLPIIFRMICLYNRKKKTIEELEGVVEERKKERKKMDDERRAAREQNLSSGSLNTPAQSSPNSR